MRSGGSATVTNNNPVRTVTANCGNGEVAIGGGVRTNGVVSISESGPTQTNTGATPTSWTVTANYALFSGSASVTAYVICVALD